MLTPFADEDSVCRLLEPVQRAPSVHNTQPWYFRIVADDRIDICARFGAGAGLAGIALSSLLKADTPVDPLAPKTPHHKPTAKSVIFLFMEGARRKPCVPRSWLSDCREYAPCCSGYV